MQLQHHPLLAILELARHLVVPQLVLLRHLDQLASCFIELVVATKLEAMLDFQFGALA